jgi:hypothetical protein
MKGTPGIPGASGIPGGQKSPHYTGALVLFVVLVLLCSATAAALYATAIQPSPRPLLCASCAPGTASSSGSLPCGACPPGKIAPLAGSTECLDCPAGMFRGPLDEECAPCPSGAVAPSAGAAECAACGPGTAATDAAAECLNCGPVAVAPLEGAAACTPCADQTVANAQGTACEACPAGSAYTPQGCEECGAIVDRRDNKCACFYQYVGPTCESCRNGQDPLNNCNYDMTAAAPTLSAKDGSPTTLAWTLTYGPEVALIYYRLRYWTGQTYTLSPIVSMAIDQSTKNLIYADDKKLPTQVALFSGLGYPNSAVQTSLWSALAGYPDHACPYVGQNAASPDCAWLEHADPATGACDSPSRDPLLGCQYYRGYDPQTGQCFPTFAGPPSCTACVANYMGPGCDACAGFPNPYNQPDYNSKRRDINNGCKPFPNVDPLTGECFPEFIDTKCDRCLDLKKEYDGTACVWRPNVDPATGECKLGWRGPSCQFQIPACPRGEFSATGYQPCTLMSCNCSPDCSEFPGGVCPPGAKKCPSSVLQQAANVQGATSAQCVDCGPNEWYDLPYYPPFRDNQFCNAACPGGTFQQAEGSCTPCPGGTYSTTGSTGKACLPSACPPGSYPDTSKTGQTESQCLPCPTGTFSSDGKSCQDMQCPPGSQPTPNSTGATNATSLCSPCSPPQTSPGGRAPCADP